MYQQVWNEMYDDRCEVFKSKSAFLLVSKCNSSVIPLTNDQFNDRRLLNELCAHKNMRLRVEKPSKQIHKTIYIIYWKRYLPLLSNICA
jgi:hypothetical protein